MKIPCFNQASLRVLLLSATLCGALTATAQVDLKHRYTFDEAPGSPTAGDFYGGANGSLTNADFTGTGAAIFNGTNAFIDLPNGIISVLTNATFEAWVTWAGGAGNFQRIFDFGNSLTGEGTSGTGSNYVFLTPRSGGNLTVFGARAAGMNADNIALTTTPLPINVLTHVAVSYNFSNSVAKLYVNGAFAAQARATQALASLQDVNNWLGRSQWGGDAYYNGLMNEFRIYDAALSAPRIAANAAAGPDNDAADPGNVTAVRLLAGPVVFIRGSQQGQVFADFENATNVNVTFGEGATFSSSNPSIVTVDTNGVLRGVAFGSAEIVATYQSLSATSMVTVVPVHGAALKHRYSFGDLPGTSVADSVGAAHGTLTDPSNRCVFTGSTLVLSNFSTTPIISSTTNGSFVDLPNGIIRVLTNATFETWVRFVPVAGFAWQRIFDFGDSTGGEGVPATGSSYIFLTPRTGTGGGTRFGLKPPTSGETVVLDGAQLPNAQRHVIVTYHTGINEARLYIEGTLVSTRPAPTPLSAINDINNWLGRAQFGGDAYFNGVYNEFRIYEGTMSEGDVVASRDAGPDVTGASAGDLVSVSLRVIPIMQGGAQAAAALANYQNVSNIDVTVNSATTFSSSDTSILTVSTNGVIVAIAPGIAMVTATHGGLSDSKAITVKGGAFGLVKHRWSFNETGGTHLSDSIGGAHGVIVNPVAASFTGGNLRLNNGGNGETTNSYVDLPNNIIRVLTNATIEMWVTWQSNFTVNWQRLIDFGSTDQGENLEGTGRTYLFLTPRSGATGNRLRSVITTASGAGERLTEALFTMAQNTETHIAIVYNSGNNGTNAAMSLYVNGTLVSVAPTATPLSALNDVNNWLGRAQYNDPYFNGSYNELRIFSGAFLPGEINASRLAGPNAVLQPVLSIRVSQVEVCWTSITNSTYQVQYTTSLVSPTWTNVGSPIQATSSTTCVFDDVPPGEPRRFYRVLLLP